MARILFAIFLFSCLSGYSQSRFEYGVALGAQKVMGWDCSDFPNDSKVYDQEVSPSFGLLAGYYLPVDTTFIRTRLKVMKERIQYDIDEYSYSRGNGAFRRYINDMEHSVLSYSLQVGFEFPMAAKNGRRTSVYLGPEFIYHQVLDSKGTYETRRFDGFYEDDDGNWISGDSSQESATVDSPFQEALDPVLGLHIGVQGVYPLRDNRNLSIGLECMMGFGSMVDQPESSSASRLSALFTVGYQVLNLKE